MNWKLAQAKQQLSKVVRLAQREPQILQNRDEPVAAVVSAQEFERFREWQRVSGKTLAGAFEDLRRIAHDENWQLEVLPRTTRANPLIAILDAERRSDERQQKRTAARRVRGG